VCESYGLTLSTLPLKPGHWRTSLTSPDLLECPNSYCAGGATEESYCVTGHTGPYCAVCGPGYSGSAAGGCSRCNERTTLASPIIIGTVFFLLFLWGVSWYLKRVENVTEDLLFKMEKARVVDDVVDSAALVTSALSKMKVVLVHVQLSSLLPSFISVKLPPGVSRFISSLDVINLDLVDISRLGCFIERNFYVDLIFYTATPMAMALVSLGVATVYVITIRRDRTLSDEARTAKEERAKGALIPFLVGLSYFL
jgi:hypothetical protein